jgi:hypothetical protein
MILELEFELKSGKYNGFIQSAGIAIITVPLYLTLYDALKS